MDVAGFFEMFVAVYQTEQHDIQEDSNNKIIVQNNASSFKALEEVKLM
jgi:hypothetical protein